jgi:hypothetical protein
LLFYHQCLLIPLVQDFFLKLKGHLLPRIHKALLQEAESLLGPNARPIPDVGCSGNACEFLFFKKDCIYHHKIIQFHFTTYDVQRGTDLVNPGTSRCNIMLLADDPEGSLNFHHFLYVRVLGVYHANVMYTGPGMHDLDTRHFDFLWV